MAQKKRRKRGQGAKITYDLCALVFDSQLRTLSLVVDRDCRGHLAEDLWLCLEVLDPPSEQSSSGVHATLHSSLRISWAWCVDAVESCRVPDKQMWYRQNLCPSSSCFTNLNIYIFPFIVFAANTHFLKLEHFTSLMGLFSAANAILKRSMIPKEFNNQVIGQVIRMWNEKNTEWLENGAHLHAKTAKEAYFVTNTQNLKLTWIFGILYHSLQFLNSLLENHGRFFYIYICYWSCMKNLLLFFYNIQVLFGWHNCCHNP